jgi:hypothetical protein
MSFSNRIASLQMRIARLERLAGASKDIGDFGWVKLPNGTRLGMQYLRSPGTNEVRLGFQCGNGAYSFMSSLENFTDMATSQTCRKALGNTGVLGARENQRFNNDAVITLPDGTKCGITVLCDNQGNCRLGFFGGGASYFAYDTMTNFKEMLKDMMRSGSLHY